MRLFRNKSAIALTTSLRTYFPKPDIPTARECHGNRTERLIDIYALRVVPAGTLREICNN